MTWNLPCPERVTRLDDNTVEVELRPDIGGQPTTGESITREQADNAFLEALGRRPRPEPEPPRHLLAPFIEAHMRRHRAAGRIHGIGEATPEHALHMAENLPAAFIEAVADYLAETGHTLAHLAAILAPDHDDHQNGSTR